MKLLLPAQENRRRKSCHKSLTPSADAQAEEGKVVPVSTRRRLHALLKQNESYYAINLPVD
jgi:hypothetical protein